MKVDKDTIQYIARLAKLEFTEEEAARFSGEFEKILGYMENIGKEELTEPDGNPESGTETVLRKDEVKRFGRRQELFRNAKEMRDGFLAVPKVLE